MIYFYFFSLAPRSAFLWGKGKATVTSCCITPFHIFRMIGLPHITHECEETQPNPALKFLPFPSTLYRMTHSLHLKQHISCESPRLTYLWYLVDRQGEGIIWTPASCLEVRRTSTRRNGVGIRSTHGDPVRDGDDPGCYCIPQNRRWNRFIFQKSFSRG